MRIAYSIIFLFALSFRSTISAVELGPVIDIKKIANNVKKIAETLKQSTTNPTI